MKRTINILKKEFVKRLDEIMIVLGTGILSYNIFNFSHRLRDYYYYYGETMLYISIGAMLLVGGLLVMRRRSHNK